MLFHFCFLFAKAACPLLRFFNEPKLFDFVMYIVALGDVAHPGGDIGNVQLAFVICVVALGDVAHPSGDIGNVQGAFVICVVALGDVAHPGGDIGNVQGARDDPTYFRILQNWTPRATLIWPASNNLKNIAAPTSTSTVPGSWKLGSARHMS